ncbi:MAG: EexN family lipoprotein [Geobacteraceae bacterium]|nr:EexN family lipoprotein [Geobacteraceae bacterium]
MNISYVRNVVTLMAILAFCLMAGCVQDKSLVTEEAKSLEWFMEHENERQEALLICKENNWQLKGLPNCEKAIRAETVARIQQKRKYRK